MERALRILVLPGVATMTVMLTFVFGLMYRQTQESLQTTFVFREVRSLSLCASWHDAPLARHTMRLLLHR